MNKLLSVGGPLLDLSSAAYAGLVSGAGRTGAAVNLLTALGDFNSTYPNRWPRLWTWAFRCKLAAAATVGNVVELYFAHAGIAATYAGWLGPNADWSNAEVWRNLTRVGVVQVDNATGTPWLVAYGQVELLTPLFVPLIWNSTGQTFSSEPTDFDFKMRAALDEVQDPE